MEFFNYPRVVRCRSPPVVGESVHTTPEEFKNGGFSLKTYLTFSVHAVFEENWGMEIT